MCIVVNISTKIIQMGIVKTGTLLNTLTIDRTGIVFRAITKIVNQCRRSSLSVAGAVMQVGIINHYVNGLRQNTVSAEGLIIKASLMLSEIIWMYTNRNSEIYCSG